MENEKTNQNCECSSNCCPPKKEKPWKKIIFIIVCVAAAALVTMKLAGVNCFKTNVKAEATSVTPTGSCDTTTTKTCVKICNPQKGKSCCPKAN